MGAQEKDSGWSIQMVFRCRFGCICVSLIPVV